MCGQPIWLQGLKDCNVWIGVQSEKKRLSFILAKWGQ